MTSSIALEVLFKRFVTAPHGHNNSADASGMATFRSKSSTFANQRGARSRHCKPHFKPQCKDENEAHLLLVNFNCLVLKVMYDEKFSKSTHFFLYFFSLSPYLTCFYYDTYVYFILKLIIYIKFCLKTLKHSFNKLIKWNIKF